MKRFALALMICAAPLTAFAQDSDPTAPVEDEVISEGTIRGTDPAMSAFWNGDYETAEIEFERNFSRIKRGEALKRASIDQSVGDAETSQLFTAQSLGGAAAENAAGLGGGAVEQAQIFNVTTSRGRKVSDDPNLMQSGTDLGFQLYMSGLSEIQLGKYGEARESLERALNFNETLHDARLRLALLDLNDGNRDGAQEQLEKLESALAQCKSRCARLQQRDTIVESIETLTTLLGQG